VPNTVGFSNAVHDGSTPQLQETSTAGLRLLTSGPAYSNPGDLLASDRVAHLFATLRADADTVFIDAPPAGIVADAAILAPQVDGVVLVISAFRTRREDATRAKEQIERVHGSLLGVVLNNARVDAIRYRY
ncbi:MAG: Non-specific protein-tyrosine kinase, partial [Chloroflexi bacterium]|nr:Non-specific protein-tyrosine kinase [Chloroflexota bacterium]